MFKLGKREIERAHIGSIERHFYLNGPIDDEEDYVDLIDTLYQGKGNENIYIHFNTPGGRLDITMQLLNAIKSTEAEVVGIADGEVASAGSILLFSCPNIAIMPYSYVMMHDGSSGFGGKMNENIKQAQFTSELIRGIYHDVYNPFFTKAEIDSVLDGKDMWVSAEELRKRIDAVVNPVQEEEQKPKRKVKKVDGEN